MPSSRRSSQPREQTLVYSIYLHCQVGYEVGQASLLAQMVKNPPTNAGDPGSIPGSGRFPGGGHGNPLQYSCLENHPGQRSLAGYSPWGRKELDMSE